MWHWAVLVVGLLLLLIAVASMRVYSREYERHVRRFGRTRFGREYGTSWTKADARGIRLAQIQWLGGPIVLAGILFYFLTGLLDRSLVLFIGTSLGVGSLVSLFWSRVASFGLAEKEVRTVLERDSDKKESER